jgi:hypothetical protein
MRCGRLGFVVKEIDVINARYDELFGDEKSKAEAFDLIADRFYSKNFGTMQKTDIETLMFSVYIERILAVSADDIKTHSDYTLSRELGISPAKVRNLKVRKELQFPNKDFDWKESFVRICKNATYADGSIKISIYDPNLFNAIQNAAEENGGYIELQGNSKLLKVTPGYFLD